MKNEPILNRSQEKSLLLLKNHIYVYTLLTVALLLNIAELASSSV